MKNKKYLPISIVIPTKNEEKNIHRLLKDIKKQKIPPYEVIVADADSIDNTKNIVDKFSGKMVQGGWPSQGRNNGGRIAKQDIILFLDADTTIQSDSFLVDMYNIFQKRDIDCATCYFESVKDEKTFYTNFTIWVMNRMKDISKLPIQALKLGFGALIIVKKSSFLSIGGFREDMRYLEDSQFIYDMTKAGFKYGIIPLKIQLNLSKKTVKSFKSKFFLILAFVHGFLYMCFPDGKLKQNLYRKAEKYYLST